MEIVASGQWPAGNYSILIEKTLPGSFTGTELESWLRDKGIEKPALFSKVITADEWINSL